MRDDPLRGLIPEREDMIATEDREWFVDHPDRWYRIRFPHPGEGGIDGKGSAGICVLRLNHYVRFRHGLLQWPRREEEEREAEMALARTLAVVTRKKVREMVAEDEDEVRRAVLRGRIALFDHVAAIGIGDKMVDPDRPDGTPPW